jgi:pyruvate dehydrogenase (quinone)
VSRTIADLVVATLKASGVRRIYGLPGDSLNGLTDALHRDGDLAWVHVRHEEAAAFAACGEASVTGELAVCAASCGPGNLHLVNGLFDAQRSGVPVLALAAHIPRVEIGGGYFQETHPQELFRECSVYAELVSIPEQLPHVLAIAMRTAIERRGVAVVVVPGEVFLDPAPSGGDDAQAILPSATVARPADAALDAAAKLLDDASRVTILAGAGCAGAHDEVVALAGRLQAPIVHTLRGKEVLEYDNPFDVGMTGLLGFTSGYRAMEHCDALLMLGTDFPYRPFFPDDARVVQVDVRGERIGRRVPVDVALVGTVKDTVDGLMGRLGEHGSEHLEQMTAHYRRARRRLDGLTHSRGDGTPMHPQVLTRAIDELAADDAVFTADVGLPTLWAARHLTVNGRRRLVGSFVHGTMANALPQAIGVQATHPDRQVVALSGDGGLSMLLGELLTLRQHRLPVKVVVYNNGALGFVELEMKADGIVNFGTDLDNPSFAAIAGAVGLHAVRVERPSELGEGLGAALAHPGPALVEVMVERQELAIPPRVSAAQASGFTLWATRSVLNGRADEVVDVARTNLRELALD